MKLSEKKELWTAFGMSLCVFVWGECGSGMTMTLSISAQNNRRVRDYTRNSFITHKALKYARADKEKKKEKKQKHTLHLAEEWVSISISVSGSRSRVHVHDETKEEWLTYYER